MNAKDFERIIEADDRPPAPGDRPAPMGRPESPSPEDPWYTFQVNSHRSYSYSGPSEEEFADAVWHIRQVLRGENVVHAPYADYCSEGGGTIRIQGNLRKIIDTINKEGTKFQLSAYLFKDFRFQRPSDAVGCISQGGDFPD